MILSNQGRVGTLLLAESFSETQTPSLNANFSVARKSSTSLFSLVCHEFNELKYPLKFEKEMGNCQV